MKVLVTGSSGLLGEALVRSLMDLGIEVIGLDIFKSPVPRARFIATALSAYFWLPRRKFVCKHWPGRK